MAKSTAQTVYGAYVCPCENIILRLMPCMTIWSRTHNNVEHICSLAKKLQTVRVTNFAVHKSMSARCCRSKVMGELALGSEDCVPCDLQFSHVRQCVYWRILSRVVMSNASRDISINILLFAIQLPNSSRMHPLSHPTTDGKVHVHTEYDKFDIRIDTYLLQYIL